MKVCDAYDAVLVMMIVSELLFLSMSLATILYLFSPFAEAIIPTSQIPSSSSRCPMILIVQQVLQSFLQFSATKLLIPPTKVGFLSPTSKVAASPDTPVARRDLGRFLQCAP
jgi:hypothetical protein